MSNTLKKTSVGQSLKIGEIFGIRQNLCARKVPSGQDTAAPCLTLSPVTLLANRLPE